MTNESTGQIPPTTSAQASHTWEVLCHALGFAGFVFPFGNILGPLIVWLMKKSESPSVDAHGKEALNFQISMTIWVLLCAITWLILVGIVLTPVAVGTGVVLTVLGTVKASHGVLYRYPLTIRFIK
ncbi:MAG TPA: DUF4870 domain-containing protein [Candidatus Binatia bacterium]|nr:DUF4870 domain-containing protein [Candidatus Binatia bacterium]